MGFTPVDFHLAMQQAPSDPITWLKDELNQITKRVQNEVQQKLMVLKTRDAIDALMQCNMNVEQTVSYCIEKQQKQVTITT